MLGGCELTQFMNLFSRVGTDRHLPVPVRASGRGACCALRPSSSLAQAALDVVGSTAMTIN